MGKKKILIVDDEMDMRIFMSALIESHGYQPLTSRDGRQGLQCARTDRPALIILDIMMPGEGGVKMYRSLKGDPQLAAIPVVMLSAVAEKSFRHFLKMLNAPPGKPVPEPEAYFEKPVDHEALIAFIRRTVG